jgi:hypothetical protein
MDNNKFSGGSGIDDCRHTVSAVGHSKTTNLLTIEFSRLCAAKQLYNSNLQLYSRVFTTLKGINTNTEAALEMQPVIWPDKNAHPRCVFVTRPALAIRHLTLLYS